jgi:hypothetical protein
MKNKGLLATVLVALVVIIGGGVYYTSQNKGGPVTSSAADNSMVPASTPTSAVADQQAIKNIVTMVLNAERNVTSFQDTQAIISDYYSTSATAQLQANISKVPTSSLPIVQKEFVTLDQGMPDPATLQFTSIDIASNMATATMTLPGVTYDTLNGKPTGKPLTTTLSIPFIKENGQWKVNGPSDEVSNTAVNN